MGGRCWNTSGKVVEFPILDLPTRDLKVHAFGDDAVEIEAVLAANAVDGEHLERLTRQLAEQPFISQAFWSPSTTE